MISESFLRRLMERLCPHRFSWPHNGGPGKDYQVCLLCGSAYEYDCTNMQRTGRLMALVNGEYEPTAGQQSV